MSFLGLRPSAARVALIIILGSIRAPVVSRGESDLRGARPQFDVIGGGSSEKILVRFRTETMARCRALRSMCRSMGQDTLPPLLGRRVHELYTHWRGLRIRPLYPLEYRYPELARRYGLDRTYIIEVPPGTDTPGMASAFCGCLEDIEAAGVTSIGGVSDIPNDPDFAMQYGMHNTGQTGGEYDADIDAPEAWDLHTGRLGTVTIAIIDSGVGPHVEFAGRMVPGINTNDYPDGPTTDECGHGTHVAGIATAEGNNDLGVAGVTWGALVMPVRVTNAACGGSSDDAAAGLIWAADHGADICNLSLQFYDLTAPGAQLLEGSVNYAHDAGALVIAAAGNGHGNEVAAPARFANCMAVTATDEDDSFAWWSNYGAEVDVCAPGDDIWSTRPNDLYGEERGTSMAAPHVSGLAALIKSYNYGLTNNEIRTLLTSTADPLASPVPNEFFGYGRINAFTALSSITPANAIVSSAPPNRAIDARQPFAVDGSDPDGWSSLDIAFEDDAIGMTPEDFTITTDPERDTPGIMNVTVNGHTVTLEFDAPIPVEAWTIVTHNDSNTKTRIGYLPGDVDGDGTSTVQDIDRLLDEISGVGDTHPIWCTDLNRSGNTTPQDVLRAIDLLNGAEAYPPFLNASLP